MFNNKTAQKSTNNNSIFSRFFMSKAFHISFLILQIILPVDIHTQTDIPDYRNRINIPEYDHSLMPLNYDNITSTGIWTELNPKVPRVDYLCIDFVGIDTGWAVGANGAIIYTINGGDEWNTAVSGVNTVLLNVNSHDGKTVIVTGYDGLILRSTDAGKTWSQIPSGVTGDLWRVQMINDTLGWISGTGSSLLKTIDGGISWQNVSTGFPNNYWYIAFHGNLVGYIAGDFGIVLKTENGGITWVERYIGDNKSLYSIKLFNERRVVIGGNLGRVAYTNDGGDTWGLTNGGFINNSIAFTNDSVGYSVGTYESSLYKTTDGGVTWFTIQTSPHRIGKNWITFVNDTLGFIAGQRLRLSKSTDGGTAWEKIFIMNEDIKDISFVSDSLGFAVDDYYVFETTNGGKKWKTIFTHNYVYSTICFVDSLTGFIGGSNLRLWSTTDGGETWQIKPIIGMSDSSSSRIVKIFFITDTIGYAYWDLGIFRTTDKGNNWYEISNLGAAPLFFLNPQDGYLIKVDDFYTSSDSGYSWTQIGQLPSSNYQGLYFKDSLYGFITSLHKLYKTIDGGVNWSLFINDNFAYGYFCWLASEHGFLTGNRVYETKNGGAAWTDITGAVGTGFQKMVSVRANLGFGGGGLGLILKYEDTSLVSAVSEVNETPVNYLTLQSYPNPFNYSTIINFISPAPGNASVKIYNILGEEIITLFHEYITENKNYLIELNGTNLPSGIYFCRLHVENASAVTKLILIK